MKIFMIGLLFTGGMLMAQDTQTQQQPAQEAHLSASQRLALYSQSPRVRTNHGKHHRNKYDSYLVTKDKGAIVAMIPYGK